MSNIPKDDLGTIGKYLEEIRTGAVKSDQVIKTTIKNAGITLTVTAAVIDSWRIGSAVDDRYIKDNADKIIEELENAIRELTKLLQTETNPTKRSEISTTIEHLENILKDVKRTKKVPVKAIKTASSVGGGMGGVALGTTGGVWGGAQTGALVGSLLGPVGAVVGAPIGAAIGGIGLGILGGISGFATGEKIADEALKLAD